MLPRRLLGLALALLAWLCVPAATAEARRGACVIGVPGPTCEVWTGTVKTVGDGDTLDVDVHHDGTRRARRIRVSGIQAMEQTEYRADRRTGECHAVDATLRFEGLVRRSRRRVRLSAADPGTSSRGRLVRHVAVRIGGRWRDVGTIQVTEGRALWWPLRAEAAPNAAYALWTQQAAARQLGLFDPDGCGPGPSAASPLQLWANWDADGDDGANPGGEWVKVRNLDPVNPVALGGWWVRDSSLRRYVFPPSAVLAPGATLTVDVGSDGDDVDTFAWGLREPVFDNVTRNAAAMGDGAYLFDPLGNVRASMIYPCYVACTDPLEGAVAIDVQFRGAEQVRLTNVSASAVDLGGRLLRSPPYAYHLQPGTVLAPGETLRLDVRGAPEDDLALRKSWGLANPILDNDGDVVELATYTDLTLACAAWGERSC